jgi:hypothetical protein
MNSTIPIGRAQRETNRILELHLGRLLPIALSSSPEHTPRPFPAATDHANAHQVSSPAASPASLTDLTQALWELLGLYVASLEASDHGGWSRAEDKTVLHFLSLLGYTVASV